MKRYLGVKVLLGMLGLLVGSACASAPEVEEEPAVFVEAEREVVEPPPPRVIRVPVVQAAPGQARPAPRAEEASDEDVEAALRQAQEEPWKVIDQANAAARSNPVEEGYFNALQVYDYSPGLLYQVYTAQGRITAIEFDAGESVRSVALGDTVRWIIGQTESGGGSSAKQLVLIKPVRSGLTTNAVITTSRRTYQLELHSYRDSYMASVSWSYPAADIQHFHSMGEMDADVEDVASPASTDDEATLGLDLTAVNFDYGFRVQDPKNTPAWMPVRVFDDGRKTFIQFSGAVRERELPAFFILSRTGRPVVANFRVRGDYMIVDQVFDLAMLRMAEAEVGEESVGIERLGGR